MRIPYKLLLFAPMASYIIGFLLNKIAIAVNGGLMPVLDPICDPLLYIRDGSHVCMTASTHLKFLCDWMVWNHGQMVSSIGDFFVDFYGLAFWPALFTWIVLMIKDAGNR